MKMWIAGASCKATFQIDILTWCPRYHEIKYRILQNDTFQSRHIKENQIITYIEECSETKTTKTVPKIIYSLPLERQYRSWENEDYT